MLWVEGVTAGYGNGVVLRDLSFKAAKGQVTCIMGRNGAGKSTLMKAIMGLVPVQSGRILLSGTVLSDLPAHQVPGQGIAYVPQGRRLFGGLTVAENIEIGLLARKRGTRTRDFVLDLFPRLGNRLDQIASTLSGGEQQMLAIARALCIEPEVLLLDEPTEGLQPSMITAIRDTVLKLRETGLATVLVEQRVDAVLRMADRVAFMEQGQIKADVPVAQVQADSALFKQFVGV
ncbi:MAG: ABC transporter ATP-binding protein [Cypionkella sp.]|jgi:branched-chain amino acid transport system ATP-binding protein|nr:ABC transporter ATP-binding protein [Cypionkella sp.]